MPLLLLLRTLLLLWGLLLWLLRSRLLLL